MSSITVDLPVEIVQQLELQAKQQGLDPQQLASDLIVEILGKQSTEKEVSEVDLLQRVNLGFGDEWWTLYQSLIELRQSGMLTEDEHLQLIEMSDALELANVDRVKALIAIAQLRGCDVKDVMKSLGISVHG
jgi:hypothetical protein